jgi:F-type H+-transporting ATPase subunit gamma
MAYLRRRLPKAQLSYYMSGQLKEVRNRIKSVTSTQQITKAMKMVSAAKLRRAQDAITQMAPYSRKLQEVLSNIVSSISGEMELPLATVRPVEKVLLIPITSDRGLCGAYNANVIKMTRLVIAEKYPSQFAKGDVTVMPLGKKGYDFFVRNNYKVVDNYREIFSDLSFDNVREAAAYAQQAFLDKKYDRIDLIYSQFRNAAVQNFVSEPYLPIPKIVTAAGTKNSDFIFEPSKETIMEELMPKILNTQVYKALLDANASEHGARMTAMDKASENANELLRSLKISYNRARQAAITTELSEIVSGAAALQG